MNQINTYRLFPYLLFAMFFVNQMSYGQIRKNFTQRTSNKAYSQYKKPGSDGKIYTLKGDFLMIGNTNLTLRQYSDNGTNSSNMKYVDVDGDPTTINSSSAQLNLPSSCSEIVYAGLYWSGRLHDGTSGFERQVYRDSYSPSESGTVTNFIEANIIHTTNPNNITNHLLNNTWSQMSLGGGGNDLYPIQILTIGDREFEFTIRNDGQVQKRERLVNGTWSQYVTLQVMVTSSVNSGTPIDSNVNYSYSNVTTSEGNWDELDISWPNFPYTSGTQNRTRTITETSTYTRTATRTLVNSGYKTYTLSNPIQYVHNGQTYVINQLRAAYKESQTKNYTQIGTATRTRTETQQRTVTRSWLDWSNYSYGPWQSQSSTNFGSYNYSIPSSSTENTVPTITSYGLSIEEVRNVANNYVKVFGPKTVTSTTSTNQSVTLDKRVVRIKKEGEPYVTISPTSANPWGMQSDINNIHFPNNADSYIYSAYVDITNYVREKGSGNYFIADVATSNGDGGTTGYFGGWGMVVIYADNTKEWRDITVFDGYAYMQGNNNEELPLSGFRAVQNGNVKVTMGMMAGEGDRGISGDNFRIRNAADSDWVYLNHSGNITAAPTNSNNFFNSSIITDGERNPSLLNNTGLDIVKFDVPNPNNSIITNNATSTRFRYGSDGGGTTNRDTYSIFNIVFAVDAYIPDVEAFNRVTAINQGLPNQILNPTAAQVANLQPGDEVSFSMDIYNYGNDPINDALLNIEIPYTMKLMNGMQMVSNNATSGSNGSYNFAQPQWIDPVTQQASSTIDDFGGLVRWNLGTIPTQNPVSNFDNRIPLARLTYKLKVTDNCLVLMSSEDNCSLNPHIDGSIGGTGAISGTPFTVSLVSGHNMECGGDPQFGPVILKVNPSEQFLSNCSANLAPQSLLIERYCGGDLTINTASIVNQYPEGTVFYSTNPTEPNPVVFNPTTDHFLVNTDYTERHYFAVLPGNPLACYLNIRTKLNQIIQTPDILNVAACKSVPYVMNINSTTPLGLNVMYFTVDPNEVLGPDEEPTYIPVTLAQVLSHWNTVGSYTYYAAYGVQNSTIPCDGVKTPFTITVSNSSWNELEDEIITICTRKSSVYIPSFSNIPSSAIVKWFYLDDQNIKHEYVNQWSGIAVANNNLNISNATIAMNGKKLLLEYQDLSNCQLYEKEITIQVDNCPIIGNPNIVAPIKY